MLLKKYKIIGDIVFMKVPYSVRCGVCDYQGHCHIEELCLNKANNTPIEFFKRFSPHYNWIPKEHLRIQKYQEYLRLNKNIMNANKEI